jgi:hypothetical protein
MEWHEYYASEIKRMSAAAYNPKQIAFALGIDKDLFLKWMNDENHGASIAFYQGLYSSELAIRESVFQLARSGSSPAQTLAIKLFDETRKTLRREGFNEEEI